MHLAYEQTGALRIVRNPKHVSRLYKRMQAWQPLGLKMYWLTGDEARQLEPLLSPDVCAAIYVPEEAQINASSLVKSFSLAAIKQGASFYSHSKIMALNNTTLKSQVCALLRVKGLLAIISFLRMARGLLTVANGCIFPYLSFRNEARRLCCINHQHPCITSFLAKLPISPLE